MGLQLDLLLRRIVKIFNNLIDNKDSPRELKDKCVKIIM